MDADRSHFITCSELEQGFNSMKVEVSRKDMANIFNILDTNKDNKVDLDEFERRLEKYMGARGGNVPA
jgi:Ca2+-binding EF-hand superfamily protein